MHCIYYYCVTYKNQANKQLEQKLLYENQELKEFHFLTNEL